MDIYTTQKWWINVFAKTFDKKACMRKPKAMGDEYCMFVYGEIIYLFYKIFILNCKYYMVLYIVIFKKSNGFKMTNLIHIALEQNVKLH